MRKELKSTTEQVHAHIDRLMDSIDATIQGGLVHTRIIADLMEDIAACNRLLQPHEWDGQGRHVDHVPHVTVCARQA